MGVLALICTTVQTPKLPPSFTPDSNTTFLQVECGLLMHSTSYFIKDDHSFSEKFWHYGMAIYLKLAKELFDSW